MRKLNNNFFAQFALLSLVTVTVFAIVITLFLSDQDSQYLGLVRQHVAAIDSGETIDPDAPYSIPSLTEDLRQHQLTDLAAVALGFGILYLALVTIVCIGWRNNRRHERDINAANENLIRSEASIRRMAEERSAVAELGRIATSAPDINDIYELIADRVGSLVPFSMLSINLVDDKKRTYTTRYVAGDHASHQIDGTNMPISGTFVEPLQEGRSAVLFQPDSIEEVRESFPSLEPGYQHGFRSYLGVALISGNRRIGTLQWQSIQPHAYSDADFGLAEQIGSQIAGALANSRLHTDLEQVARDREALAEIGRIISSSLAIEDIYEGFAQTVRELIPSDRIVINIVNTDSQTYRNVYLSGSEVANQGIGRELPLDGTQNQVVANTKTSHLIQCEDGQELVNSFPGLADGVNAGLRSFLCVPLISNEQTIGALNLRAFSPNAYAQRHVNLAERVAGQIAGAIANAQLHAERQQAEAALQVAEEKYRVLVENANDLIVLLQDARIVYCNVAAESLLGYKTEELMRFRFIDTVAPEHREMFRKKNQSLMQEANAPGQYEVDLLTKEGFRVSVEVRSRIVEYQGHDATMIVMRDVSERKRLEEQLFQAQKMESIGKLAGGVAHDFNNLLSAILGFTQLADSQLADDEKVNGHYLKQVETAAERGASLVRQLLAFSRRQMTAPIVLSANEQIENLDKMLRRLIGEHVELNLELSEDAGMVLVDPGQLDQVLINLAVNARDAMPAGGRLTIKTESITLGAESANLDPELSPGRYVTISVSDDGIGMTADVAAKAFEPFFTTKDVGEGTGLGLSTCYGIVKQNRGHITVESEPGAGTTFTIYIPKSVDSPVSSAEAKQYRSMIGGSETVLLVEDEEAVREITVEALETQGYNVLEATNGKDAIRVMESRQCESIDLLLTDVVMPIMGGRELAEWYRATFPDGKVIYMSGYSDDLVTAGEVAGLEGNFLQKPASLSELSTKVRQALDG